MNPYVVCRPSRATQPRAAAVYMAYLAAGELQLPVPRIRWFHPTDLRTTAVMRLRYGARAVRVEETPMAGCVVENYPDTIFLDLTTRDPHFAAHVVAHECRHLWQWRRQGTRIQFDPRLSGIVEADAEQYGREAVRRHWPTIQSFIQRYELQ